MAPKFAWPAEMNFEDEIAPLIAKRCLECHNPIDAKGGLNLASHDAALQGGESGVVLVAGKPQESYLLERLEAGEMPPEVRGRSQKLPDAEIAALQRWITAGVKWPRGRTLSIYEKTTDVRAGLDWWSLQPVQRPAVPEVQNAPRVANPIDAFILARLEQAALEPAPLADQRTLIRRAYFDLIGLPPSPEEMSKWLSRLTENPTARVSPDDRNTRGPRVAQLNEAAYQELIDHLLDSKHYGERWARYWLDLVRFAETCGYERDQLKPNIWRYRDWVINALNSDLPYDRFVTDQLAGDEVPYRDEQSVIATGMLRAGTWNDEPNDPADSLYTRLEDMVHTTTSAFLGLTVKCARCHDHKFDPIRQTDYYRTASFFWPGYIGPANLGGPNKDQLGFDVFGWTDREAKAEPIRLLIKGERHRPGQTIQPGSLSSVPALDKPFAPPPAGSKTTHRRLQFARWITNPRNPLTARVMVNRLWQHHFGEALVRTPNNFGFKSDPPEHPRLLDWLAAEFVNPTILFHRVANDPREDGDSFRETRGSLETPLNAPWTLKRMHKLIMLSNTYRQASVHPRHHETAEKDSLNRLWWRFNRRRLDAEALRDAMLAASGQLNRQTGGPSFFPKMSAEALEGLSRKSNAWGRSSPEQRARRSIYMMTKRSRLLPLMTTFDFCDTTLPCGQRDVTIVATQALALLNNNFAHKQSEAMARRLMREVADDGAQQIERAWQLAFARSPRKDEVEAASAHLEAQLAHFETAFAQRFPIDQSRNPELDIKDKLVLWLRAEDGVQTDDMGGVMFWQDRSPVSIEGLLPHDASQAKVEARPKRIANAINGRPALRFDGKQHFMHLAGTVVWSQQFSIFAVTNHRASAGAAREIISNWHHRGRTTTSVFLGTTGLTGIRFTDAFSQAGNVSEPTKPFILTGISAGDGAFTFHNRSPLASSDKLAQRDLSAPYVIGTQGNHNNEWWHGDIAEILVYDRALDETERETVWRYLAARYGIKLQLRQDDLQLLALASLCHVLLNTNEFIYVD